MSKLLTTLVALSAAGAGVSARPSNLDTRATSSTFSLFAYGTETDTEIGGFPIFYHTGYAYIADPAKVNYTTDYVGFTKNSTSLVANPLTVDNNTWADSLFYTPVGYGPCGFYKEGVSTVSESAILTTGFTFYGTTAMIKIDGTLYTEWYAVPTATQGLWSVGWNATGANVTTAELLSIRKAKPPNVKYPSST